MLWTMETKEFENTVGLGLGRAVLHLLDHDARPYREIILDACLHNKAYDPQVEGSRAVYMLEMMRASGELAFYADAVIPSLVEEADDWDTSQRFQIARLLAQDGNQSARQAMHSAFQTKMISDNEVAAEFIELDGLAGLVFVVRRIGELLTQNPERWEDDYLLWVASDIYGKEEVEAALKNAAETDTNIKAYLNAVEENRTLRALNQRPDPTSLTYGDVRSLIEANKAGGILHLWAKTASESNLRLAADDLTKETDAKKLKLYLGLFRKRKFPRELDHLFRLVELPDGPVPRHALGVLANLEHERIRSIAFSLVETRSSLRDYAIDLLVNNFHDRDHAIIEAWCDAELDLGTLNAFDRSLRDFFAAHPDSECEGRLLRKLYEREPCAHCRSSVVERLLALGALPETLRRECEYDSYADTRELVKHRNN